MSLKMSHALQDLAFHASPSSYLSSLDSFYTRPVQQKHLLQSISKVLITYCFLSNYNFHWINSILRVFPHKSILRRRLSGHLYPQSSGDLSISVHSQGVVATERSQSRSPPIDHNKGIVLFHPFSLYSLHFLVNFVKYQSFCCIIVPLL